MNICVFGGAQVPWELVGIDQNSFGGDRWKRAIIPYRIELPRDYVINEFEPYYVDFNERESDVDPEAEPMSGETWELYRLGFPPLVEMYDEHSDLLARVIFKMAANEFMGYVCYSPSVYDYKYMLQTFSTVRIVGGVFHAEGLGMLNSLYKEK